MDKQNHGLIKTAVRYLGRRSNLHTDMCVQNDESTREKNCSLAPTSGEQYSRLFLSTRPCTLQQYIPVPTCGFSYL